jgi:mannosyl-3-phosphoglycerate phosphatase
MKNLIVFTDLDGTLLDKRYSFTAARSALTLIREQFIPLIVVSSKTRFEIQFYRESLNNQHPFISENGGGVFIPIGYFGPNVIIPMHHRKLDSNYDVITLGAKYADLRKVFNALQNEGFSIKGFGDMTAEEVARAMGLSIAEAEMAKQRDFDEPFFYTNGEEKIESLFDSIREKGFNVTKGRIYHLLGQSNKGKAVSMLIELYRKKLGNTTTVALGDSPNDKPMLEKADIPIIVQKPDGSYDPVLMSIPKITRAKGIGPEGWNRILIDLMTKLMLEGNKKDIDKVGK